MPDSVATALLDDLLDSWDRNDRILRNLLLAVPPGGLEVKATPTSPSVSRLFTHIHYVRLVFITEDAPEFSRPLPEEEWREERDAARIAGWLEESARAVREAVRARVSERRDMEQHYDHPLLFLQHMIWHEGYHHGQIKLALKLAGHAIHDEDIGPGTWGVWMRKTRKTGK